VALVALFVSAALVEGLGRTTRAAILAVAFVAIAIANYRTAIIGILPLAGYFLVTGTMRLFHHQLRSVIVITAALALVVGGGTALVSMDRFYQLRTIARGEAALIKPPSEFTAADKRIMSHRPFIWSNYYYTWKDDGGQVQHVIGFGADSWRGYFKAYAHNSFIGFLFEYGIVGVIALILFIASGLAMAARTIPGERAKLLTAHLCFILLNLATMPMWQIEGLSSTDCSGGSPWIGE
jgi:hypothetical protein